MMTPEERAAFIEERKTGLGGSDIAAILGLPSPKSRLEVWAEKTGRMEPKDLSDREYVRMGARLEPVIAELYTEATGRTLRKAAVTGVRHPEKSFMLAHPDYYIDDTTGKDPQPASGDGVFDSKNTIKAADWAPGTEDEDGAIDDSPIGYQIQVQHYCYCTGLKWGALGALIMGNRFRYHEFERNDAFIRRMVEIAEEFWDMVQRDVPPEPTGHKGEREAIKALYPWSTGAEIELPQEFSDVDEQLIDVKARIATLEEEKERLSNRIRMAIGDNLLGILPGRNGSYSYKLVEKKEYTVKATSYRELRRLKK